MKTIFFQTCIEILSFFFCRTYNLENDFGRLSINQKTEDSKDPNLINDAKAVEQPNWIYNLIGCFKPMLNIINKVNPEEAKNLQSKKLAYQFILNCT